MEFILLVLSLLVALAAFHLFFVFVDRLVDELTATEGKFAWKVYYLLCSLFSGTSSVLCVLYAFSLAVTF